MALIAACYRQDLGTSYLRSACQTLDKPMHPQQEGDTSGVEPNNKNHVRLFVQPAVVRMRNATIDELHVETIAPIGPEKSASPCGLTGTGGCCRRGVLLPARKRVEATLGRRRKFRDARVIFGPEADILRWPINRLSLYHEMI